MTDRQLLAAQINKLAYNGSVISVIISIVQQSA